MNCSECGEPATHRHRFSRGVISNRSAAWQWSCDQHVESVGMHAAFTERVPGGPKAWTWGGQGGVPITHAGPCEDCGGVQSLADPMYDGAILCSACSWKRDLERAQQSNE
jgi:hypothetical protein